MNIEAQNTSLVTNEEPLIKGNPTFSSISDQICGIVEKKPPKGWWILFLGAFQLESTEYLLVKKIDWFLINL